jgi:dihydroflavonol-4-reductase
MSMAMGSRAALVLGASGHVGQAATRELAARGYRVTAATRRPAIPTLEGLDVTVAPGDADDPGQLEEWVAGHDLVVDAAAPYPLSLLIPDKPEERDPIAYAVRRTRAVLDTVGTHGARLAFVSSFTTLPRRSTGSAELGSLMRRGVYPYFRAKKTMEDLVLTAAQRGLPAVVVNPAACLGPWDSRGEEASFVRAVLAARVPVVMHQVVNVIDVRDVATSILAALDAERYGRQIPLAGHNIAADALARRIADLAGVPAPALTIDSLTASALAFWGELSWAAIGRPAPLALRAIPLAAEAWPMEQSDEQRALGVPIRPLDDTLRDAVRWHTHTGPG